MGPTTPLGALLLFAAAATSGQAGFTRSATSGGTVRLLKVRPDTEAQLLWLQSLRNTSTAGLLDVTLLETPSKVGEWTDALGSQDATDTLSQELNRLRIPHRTFSDDLQRDLSAREARDRALRGFRRRFRDASRSSGRGLIDLNKYQSLEAIHAYLDRLAASFPRLARVLTLGTTHEGRPIKLAGSGWVGYDYFRKGLRFYLVSRTMDPAGEAFEAIEISEEVRSGERKKTMFIEAGMHAREWVAPHTALYLIARLVRGASRPGPARDLLKKLRWVIVPSSNPDGYHHTHVSRTDPDSSFWRKNRSPLRCHRQLPTRCCQGVDLNRNFDFEWGRSDTSADPCSDVFPGTGPFSEPETRAIRDFVNGRRGEVVGFLSLHAYSQILAYSSAAYRGFYPPDASELQRLGDRAASALSRRYGTQYKVGSSADELYPASGTALDWAKERARVKFAYLLELRPDQDYWNTLDAFFPQPETLLPTARETWEAVRTIAKAASRLRLRL